MQKEQIDTLKKLTGSDFEFVPANKNEYGIRYYEHKCRTDDEFQDIAGRFNDYNFDNESSSLIYRCIEHPDKTCSMIVLENDLDAKRYDSILYKRITDLEELKPIGKLHGNDVRLEPILTTDKTYKTVVSVGGRTIVVVNINGRRLPFYVSSGKAGKEQEFGIPSGKWYPLQGISPRGWLNKMPNMLKNPYPELDQVCAILDQQFPATQMKQEALNHNVPEANWDDLLKTANFDFPEGMPPSEFSNYTFVKNHCVYLPQIIQAWRSEPMNYLNVPNGILAAPGQEILNKVQEMKLFCGLKLEGDYIWLSPIEDSEYIADFGWGTDEDILYQLQKMGVRYQQIITKKGERGFGIPTYCFVDYFQWLHRQNYAKATAQLEQAPKPQSDEKSKIQMFLQNVSKILKP